MKERTEAREMDNRGINKKPTLDRAMDFENGIDQNDRFFEIQYALLAQETWNEEFIDNFCHLARRAQEQHIGASDLIKGALGEAIVKRIWRSGAERWIADREELILFEDGRELDKNKVDLRGFIEREGVVESVDIQIKSANRLLGGEYWLIDVTNPSLAGLWILNRNYQGYQPEVQKKVKKAIERFNQGFDAGNKRLVLILGCGEKDDDQVKRMLDLAADLDGEYCQNLLNDLETLIFNESTEVESRGIIH